MVSIHVYSRHLLNCRFPRILSYNLRSASICQLRELDSNIKWEDIENTHPVPTLDKESKKSVRLFKKVVIRRKSIQNGVVKYLLDFGGKRRAIPDVVLKNGSMVDESSNEKKKYWLEKPYLPLYLLKNFEEKRIGRKSNDVKSMKLIESGRVVKRPRQEKGFSYLFAKAERSDHYECGHCHKDVLIRYNSFFLAYRFLVIVITSTISRFFFNSLSYTAKLSFNWR